MLHCATPIDFSLHRRDKISQNILKILKKTYLCFQAHQTGHNRAWLLQQHLAFQFLGADSNPKGTRR
jgi:hypothetical protein